MIKDIHQQWLSNCAFREVHLEQYLLDKDIYYCDIPDYSFGPDLFDMTHSIRRTVKVSELDTKMITEDDWNLFIQIIKNNGITELILLITHSNNSNKIVASYRKCTIQSYIYRLLQAGISCRIGYMNEA